MTLKQEIETQVLPDMEARLNNKIDAIRKIVGNKKEKKSPPTTKQLKYVTYIVQ